MKGFDAIYFDRKDISFRLGQVNNNINTGTPKLCNKTFMNSLAPFRKGVKVRTLLQYFATAVKE